jgi:hypothetical protein
MGVRYYDPDVGRFISEDPVGLTAGINLYTFAGNDPVNGYDHDGTCFVACWIIDLIIGAVAGTVANEVNNLFSHSAPPFSSAFLGGICSGGPNAPPQPPPRGPKPPIPVNTFRLTPGCAAAVVGGAIVIYEVYRWVTPSRPKPPVTKLGSFGRFKACFASHFHLGELKETFNAVSSAVRGVSYLGALPIPKSWLGVPRLPGTSAVTNPISAARFVLPEAALSGKFLGTTSLYGAAGRANVLLAAGFAAYDVTSLGLCTFTNDPDYGP